MLQFFRLTIALTIIQFAIITIVHASTKTDRELIESLKCSRVFSHFERHYRIPADTLHSIALQESGKAHSQHKIKVVWPWTANIDGQGYYFDSKQQAVHFIKQQLMLGKKNIDIGCMQISLKNHPSAFVSIEHAFDPTHNVAYAAKFLRSKYDKLQSWAKAVAHYHSATPELGDQYKKSVITIVHKMPSYKADLKKLTRNMFANNPHRIFVNNESRKQIWRHKRQSFASNDRNRSEIMVRIPQTYR